jgi:hypothetical protein
MSDNHHHVIPAQAGIQEIDERIVPGPRSTPGLRVKEQCDDGVSDVYHRAIPAAAQAQDGLRPRDAGRDERLIVTLRVTKCVKELAVVSY